MSVLDNDRRLKAMTDTELHSECRRAYAVWRESRRHFGREQDSAYISYQQAWKEFERRSQVGGLNAQAIVAAWNELLSSKEDGELR